DEGIVIKLLVAIVVVAVVAGGGATWWIASANDPATIDAIGDSVQTKARGQLPAFADRRDTPELYRVAVEHPDGLTFMPSTWPRAAVAALAPVRAAAAT